MTSEQKEEFERLARPLVEWLNNNWHPHVTVLITPIHAEIMEGLLSVPIIEYVKD